MPTDVRPSEWPQGSGYAHGMMAEGRVLCLAGQIGWDARTQLVVPGVPARLDLTFLSTARASFAPEIWTPHRP